MVGDGGFQMSAPELTTLAVNQLPVKMLILNNGCLGMVRQWQELFYDNVYSHSILPQPDFPKLAEAHGVPGRPSLAARTSAEAIRWARRRAARSCWRSASRPRRRSCRWSRPAPRPAS